MKMRPARVAARLFGAAGAVAVSAAAAQTAAPQTVAPAVPAESWPDAWAQRLLPTLQSLDAMGELLRDRLSGLLLPSGVRLTPTLSLQEIVTDNVDASARARADAITQISAGLGATYRGARVNAALDYQFSQFLYLAGTRSNDFTNSLAGTLRGDFFERRLDVQANAAIARAATSAFGAQPVAGGTPSSNDTDRLTLNVQAGWRSLLPAQLELSARGALGVEEARGTDLGDASRLSAGVRLGGPRERTLSWETTADVERYEFPSQPSQHSERLQVGVTSSLPWLDLRLSVRGGVESTNIPDGTVSGGVIGAAGAGQPTYQRATAGASLLWRPSPRTNVSANWDRRAFGNTWSLIGEYRTALSFARLSAARSYGNIGGTTLQSADPQANTGAGTLVGLLDAQLATRVPDAAQRLQQIGAFLRSNNLNPAGGFNPAALSATPTIDRSIEAIVGTRLGRTNATLALSNIQRTRLPGVFAALGDDFALTSRITTTALTGTVNHALSPRVSAQVALTLNRSTGDSQALRLDQQSLNVQVGGNAGFGTVWSLGARASHVDTVADDYFVHAIYASLGWRF